ncbi:MAG: DNA polymerase IV [Thermoplasmatota archaeon]
MDQRIRFHVDMDAFYASVHIREHPEWRDVPLVVGADPKQGRGRGVVTTCNYPARRFGLHSAMPISKAWQLCPQATFIRPDFRLYKPASQEVMEVLATYADILQVVGMDEAYLDVTEATGGDWHRATAMARSLQAAVRRRTGLGCSMGVAPTKSVAKIASDHRKPHGVTVVTPEDVPRFLDPLPVRLINGCGPKTAARLEEWGVPTVGELARTERTFLEERFGSHGGWLHDIANGIDHREVTDVRGPGKSRGNERTYHRDERDPGVVRASARKLLVGLLDDKDRRAFSTLTVKLRYSDFTTLTRSHTLSIPLDPDGECRALTIATMESLLDPLLDGRAVRLVGVRLSGFTARTGQRSLEGFGLAMPPDVRQVNQPSARQSLRCKTT